MPATSAKQRAAMAIAEHNPSQLYGRNKGMLSMTQGQLHDFASTKGLGAPKGASNPNTLTKTTRPKSALSKQSNLLPKQGLNGGRI